jgi:cytoskeletal protein CcmA (bactofilin family)
MADYNINGSGSISGGEYDNIGVSGSCTMSGHVKCKSMCVSGSCRGDGDVVCAQFKGSGSVRAHSITADKIECSGSLSCDELKAQSIGASGSVKTDSIEADRLVCSGAIKAEGLVNAESMLLTLGGNSQIGTIGGSEITVKRGHGVKIFGIGLGNSGSLAVGTIEGDVVCLENTRADTVRGDRVFIGEGCEIGRVEYGTSYECAKGSTVGSAEKSE